MSEFFSTIGGIIALLGIGWCVLIFAQPSPYAGGEYTGMAALGRVLALLPGISVIGSGLVFLAIGGVLGRLDRIARNTAAGAIALERIAGATRGAADERREPRA